MRYISKDAIPQSGGFITGHRPKDSNSGNDSGDRWIEAMAAEIDKYPRY